MLEKFSRPLRVRVLVTLGDQAGQILVEYSLIVASITLICVAVLTGIGHTVTGLFSNAANGL
jgi:Flp pilus assembly pilin Flp